MWYLTDLVFSFSNEASRSFKVNSRRGIFGIEPNSHLAFDPDFRRLRRQRRRCPDILGLIGGVGGSQLLGALGGLQSLGQIGNIAASGVVGALLPIIIGT